MGGLGTLKPGSGDSHWAGISKMYRHISVGALRVEIQAFKVGHIFYKVSKDFPSLEGSWASWGGPGSQEDPQAHCPWVVDGFRLWNFSNQTSIPRVIHENSFWDRSEDAYLCLWHCLHFPGSWRTLIFEWQVLDPSSWSQTPSLVVVLVSRMI